MTPETVPGRARPTAGPAAGPARASGLDRRIARTRVGLALAGNMVRDPRNHRHLIMAAIAVAALAQLGKENRASMMARLVAWDQRQKQKLQHEVTQVAKELTGD